MSALNDILAGRHEGPFLSLYQPTHRSHPQNKQDSIRFRNLVKALDESLRTQYRRSDVAALLAPFHALAADERFWNHTLDGLAVLGASGLFWVGRLQRPVAELAVAADSLHLKPLLRIVQSADRYQVLGVSRQDVKLFEGNRDAMDEIDLDAQVPRTLSDALTAERKEPHKSVWVPHAGGRSARASVGILHSQGGDRADEIARDTEKFFRAVDRAILERHSRPSGLPLVLAALPEHHTLFRRLSRNPYLLDDALGVHPDAISTDALRERAWRTIEPHYLARLAGLLEMCGAARAKELGSDDLDRVIEAAAAGRVATLLVQAERENARIDDRVDDAAELVLRNGGQVVVVPVARMPTRTGVAAIYRF
jgi:hypothetical protein